MPWEEMSDQNTFHTADPFSNDLIKVAVGFWIANSETSNFTCLTNKDLNATFVSGEIKSAARRFGKNNEFAIFKDIFFASYSVLQLIQLIAINLEAPSPSATT